MCHRKKSPFTFTDYSIQKDQYQNILLHINSNILTKIFQYLFWTSSNFNLRAKILIQT